MKANRITLNKMKSKCICNYEYSVFGKYRLTLINKNCNIHRHLKANTLDI